MELLIHRTPSVGSITKKIISINPELSARDIAEIVRSSMQTLGEVQYRDEDYSEFSSAQVINEERALRLAKATLTSAV